MDNFFSVGLSAGYFDILKDRLYTFATDSKERRAAQTVLYDILKSFIVVVAPILSFTAEEIWQSSPEAFKVKEGKSVFQASWPPLKEITNEAKGRDFVYMEALAQEWETIFAVKRAVLKSLEGLRQAKTIGSSLEGEVELFVGNDKVKKVLQKHLNDLRYFFLVSKVELKDGEGSPEALAAEDANLKLKTIARKSSGQKCARCWNYYSPEEMDKTYPDICRRCGPIVKNFQPVGDGQA